MSRQTITEKYSFENPIIKAFTLECVMDMFIKRKVKMPKQLLEDAKKHRLISDETTKLDIKKMKELNKDNEEVQDIIKMKFNEYRHEDKYYGGGHHQMRVMTNGDNGESIDRDLRQFMSEKMNAKAFTYNRQYKALTWLDTKDIHTEFKRFKGQVKQGVIKVEEYNNKALTMKNNDTKWYVLVLQHADDSQVGMDLGGIKIFQFMVDGICYFFQNEQNRDKMYKYLDFEDLNKKVCEGCGDSLDICESSSHPCYKCDGGCGKVMGSNDDCIRICEDCK